MPKVMSQRAQVVSRMLAPAVPGAEAPTPIANADLLQRIMMATYFGRLVVNGQLPDDALTVADYLFDSEHMMFDFARLSPEKKQAFLTWLKGSNQEDTSYYGRVSVTEFRGAAMEVHLTLWGLIKNWFSGKTTQHWDVKDFEINLDYQLTGIEMNQSDLGLLVGFNQHNLILNENYSDASRAKYQDPQNLETDDLGNTKRVVLTDHIVDLLLAQSEEDRARYCQKVCEEKHPQAIPVTDYAERFEAMEGHRAFQRFPDNRAWYIKLWEWVVGVFRAFIGLFRAPVVESTPVATPPYTDLLEEDDILIYQRDDTHEIIVQEKMPDTDILVFAGGGIKIFGHVGALRALHAAGMHPTRFAGSSAGAIMSLFCYLGYTADEIEELILDLDAKQLAHLEISLKGITSSTTDALRAFLDYVVAKKLTAVIEAYKEENPGSDIQYPEGKISFAVLHKLKEKYGLGFGELLVVTTTNKVTGKTEYSSHLHKSYRHRGVTETVTASASLPLLFKPTLIEGVEQSDGGILKNLPTNFFQEEACTTLESEEGINYKLMPLVFKSEATEHARDKTIEEVIRDNWLTNLIYSLISGIKDPASGFAKDREDYRLYAGRAIVIDPDNLSIESIRAPKEDREAAIRNGEKAVVLHLESRYSKNAQGLAKRCGLVTMFVDPTKVPFAELPLQGLSAVLSYNNKLYYADKTAKAIYPLTETKENKETYKSLQARFKNQYLIADTEEREWIKTLIAPISHKVDFVDYAVEDFETKNEEVLYSTFSSLGELLAYCAYRNNRTMFHKVIGLIGKSDLSEDDKARYLQDAQALKNLYFQGDEASEEASDSEDESEVEEGYSADEESEEEMEEDSPSDDTYTVEKKDLFLKLFPLILSLKVMPDLVEGNPAASKELAVILHHFSLEDPLACLDDLERLTGCVLFRLPEKSIPGTYKTYDQVKDLLDGRSALIASGFNLYFADSSKKTLTKVTCTQANSAYYTALLQNCKKVASFASPADFRAMEELMFATRDYDNKLPLVSRYDERLDILITILRACKAGEASSKQVDRVIQRLGKLLDKESRPHYIEHMNRSLDEVEEDFPTLERWVSKNRQNNLAETEQQARDRLEKVQIATSKNASAFFGAGLEDAPILEVPQEANGKSLH